MENLLIGAISANYKPSQIEKWVSTSKWENCDRALLLYNNDQTSFDLLNYLLDNNIIVITPTFNFWGGEQDVFEYNTAKCNFESSYNLVHNVRFFHIWNYLQEHSYEKVLVTDVSDVYFNKNPFDCIPNDKLIATSEEIVYNNHNWNQTHLHYNLGVIGLSLLANSLVYNVGVFGGSGELVKQMASDIYLLSVGKPKVADQIAFNYLLKTKYQDMAKFSNINDKFAVHLHVIHEGLVEFDFNSIPEYSIIHQYNRFNNWENLVNERKSV